ncbi:hypothetical protein [Nodosilinea sp. E11]|uniref:hypothetical protein n=1 Tax=Nodosilinea sp. E11 TaxID=3037479 RepID=UPI0029346EBC|nr:hypothetical protein [Nodosilinea sp. E11]WOD39972.1 hypothetical protein RRF56_04115 [Nodosilinea sp. E11]
MDKQDDQARERLTQQRQHDEHSHDAMRTRADDELHEDSESSVEAKARQAMANQVRHAHHAADNLRERSEEELH